MEIFWIDHVLSSTKHYYNNVNLVFLTKFIKGTICQSGTKYGESIRFQY